MATTIQISDEVKEKLEGLKIHKRQPFNEVLLELIRDKEAGKNTEERQKQVVNSLEEIKKLAAPILRNHRIKKAAVFGSFARGDFDDKSDVDILIERPDKFSLFDLAGLHLDLEGALGRKVDIVIYNSVNPLIKGRVMKEKKDII
jgi:hypothetical protein